MSGRKLQGRLGNQLGPVQIRLMVLLFTNCWGPTTVDFIKKLNEMSEQRDVSYIP